MKLKSYLLPVIFFALVIMSSYANANLHLEKNSFAYLPGWQQDNQALALQSFQHSCHEILQRNQYFKVTTLPKVVTLKNWQRVCWAAYHVKANDKLAARKFFETWFYAYRVSDNHNKIGLFTGYYLPLIQVQTKPSQGFIYPIHALPRDLIKVDLGLFNANLHGKYIIGQAKNNQLIPYLKREAIYQRKNSANTPVLFWGNNAIDIYFAQIQGSAVVQLPNKKKILIGYAGTNGRAYTSIGRLLIDKNEISQENVSMQSIRKWLIKHPKKMNALLNQNASFVFFRKLNQANPLGTEQVPLMQERSLAVDKRYIPLGAPIWLNTLTPSPTQVRAHTFRHLLIAQDTGGAIKGIVRGDVYWGEGSKAEFMAGHMNSPGEYWLLLPK